LKDLSGKDNVGEAKQEIENRLGAVQTVVDEYNSLNVFVLAFSRQNIAGFSLTKKISSLDDVQTLEQALKLFDSQILTPTRNSMIKAMGQPTQGEGGENNPEE
jgi:hypothetical protein